MAINFPSAPVQGQVYEFGNYRYTWDGIKWTSIVKYGASAVKVQEPVAPGAPEPGLQWFDDESGRTYFWHINDGTDQGQWVEDSPQGVSEAVGDEILVTAAGSTTARTLADRAADVVNVKDFGAVGDGVADDGDALKMAFEAGGNICLGSTETYRITGQIRFNLNGDTTIFSTGAVIKYDGPQIADDVVTVIHMTGSGVETVETAIKLDGSLATTNFIPVGLTVNGAKIWREHSTLYNLAAGANPVNVENFIMNNFHYSGMKQTTTGSSFGGTYGYGVVLVNVENGIISNGVLGTINSPIERHSVYASGELSGANHCGSVIVDSVTCEQIRYTDDGVTPETGFESCFKTINTRSFKVNNTITNGGKSFIDATRRPLAPSGGYVTFEGNVVRTEECSVRVFAQDGSDSACTPWTRIYGGDGNNFTLVQDFARAMRLQLVGAVIDNSTYTVTSTSNTYAYDGQNITTGNPTGLLNIQGIYSGFTRLFTGGNIDALRCDCEFWNQDGNLPPFTYSAAVSSRSTRIREVNTDKKYYRQSANAGWSGVEYFEEDFQSYIKCVDGTVPIWIDQQNQRVSAPLAQRPYPVQAGHKFWEIDQNRFVYWTGSTWWTSDIRVPDSGTTAEILALSDNVLGNGQLVYNTTTYTPYWYDDALNQWKDASGTILT